MDDRQRALGALRLLASEHGIPGELEQLEQADDWRDGLLAMACEALAALVLEVKPRSASKLPRASRP